MERLENTEEMRFWKDHIPLQWKYTAGVAGDRFLQLLKQGKIQASMCKKCNKVFLPPKIFCKDCFVQVNEWRDVPGDSGHVYSFTELSGNKGDKQTVVLVKFDGIEGGLLGRLRVSGNERPRIGMKVKTVFKPKDLRKGELGDIAYFEKTNLS
jgi:uncharacterized OB-fold protein